MKLRAMAFNIAYDMNIALAHMLSMNIERYAWKSPCSPEQLNIQFGLAVVVDVS